MDVDVDLGSPQRYTACPADSGAVDAAPLSSLASPATPVDLRAAERRASLSLLASSTLFAAMALVARLASARIPGPQIALVRFAVGAVFVLGAALFAGVELRPRRWGWLFARGAFGGVAVLSYFSCIQHVGVGVATLLNHTAPVWSMILGWLLLGERPRPRAVAAIGVTTAGVALVVGAPRGGLGVGLWELVGLFSAATSAMAVTAIRAVRRQGPGGEAGEGHWTVFASFTTLGMLATLPGVVGPLGAWVPPSGGDWLLLLGTAGFSIAAQLIMTKALEHVTATASGIVHQLTVVLALAGGILFFGETLDLRAALGSALTIAGVVWVVLAS